MQSNLSYFFFIEFQFLMVLLHKIAIDLFVIKKTYKT